MTTATVRQLDIFAQLVASGSVTGCARDMGISRSTVERGLRALEARIGHKLFDMKGGEAMLTATGEKALRALQMLRSEETRLNSSHEWISRMPSSA